MEEKIFKGFCYLQPWRPSWSCDLNHLYKLSFPLPKNAPHEALALIDQAVSEENIFEIVDDGRTDGRRSNVILFKLTL